MNIDWNSLLLVAVTTVVAAIAVVGIFSVGVLTLTGGNGNSNGNGAGTARPVGPLARVTGGACVVIAVLLVVYGLYLIIPQFH